MSATAAENHSTNWLNDIDSASIFNGMLEHNAGRLDVVFRALADATRRAMLHELSRQDRSIGELAAPHRMSLAAASKHVKVLENAGLVERRVRGRTHWCRLLPARLAEAHEWLRLYEHFWNTHRASLFPANGEHH